MENRNELSNWVGNNKLVNVKVVNVTAIVASITFAFLFTFGPSILKKLKKEN